jgi:transposase-like protein
VAEGEKEDLEGWRSFLCHLRERGLKGVRLIISDACRGLMEAAVEVFPKTDWQRCVVHFYRNVFGYVPNGQVAEVARMLKAIHAQEDRRAAKTKATEVVERLKAMKLCTAAELVEQRSVRRCPTMPIRRPTGDRSGPTIHWKESFERSDDELE